jgi:hypothetical protein
MTTADFIRAQGQMPAKEILALAKTKLKREFNPAYVYVVRNYDNGGVWPQAQGPEERPRPGPRANSRARPKSPSCSSSSNWGSPGETSS